MRFSWGVTIIGVALFLAAGNGWADESAVPHLLKSEDFTEGKIWTRAHENKLVVAARLNGHDVRLIVDTGSAYTTISRKVAERQGITAEKPFGPLKGLNGNMDENADVAKIDSFTIGGMELTPTPVLIANIHYAYLVDNGFDGVLGLLAMKANHVVFGYVAPWFYFNPTRAASVQLGGNLRASGYDEINLRYSRGRYFLPMTIDGAVINGQFDSGTQYTTINPVLIQREHLPISIRRHLIASGVDGQSAAATAVNPRRLAIGGHAVPTVSVVSLAVPLFAANRQDSEEAIDALIGFDLMAGQSLLVDTGNDALYLRKAGE